MREGESAPLEYETSVIPPRVVPMRGPVPDGYLGHRATPEELETIADWEDSEYEPVRLGLRGWAAVVILGPIIVILMLGLLMLLFVDPG